MAGVDGAVREDYALNLMASAISGNNVGYLDSLVCQSRKMFNAPSATR
jgi:hypothetical protein